MNPSVANEFLLMLGYASGSWSGQLDSNQRPLRPERSALNQTEPCPALLINAYGFSYKFQKITSFKDQRLLSLMLMRNKFIKRAGLLRPSMDDSEQSEESRTFK